MHNQVSPGERNPIKGKFGQAKTAYGLNRIEAILKTTSEALIVSIILVLNLVKLAGEALPYIIVEMTNSFSARVILKSINRFVDDIVQEMICTNGFITSSSFQSQKIRGVFQKAI